MIIFSEIHLQMRLLKKLLFNVPDIFVIKGGVSVRKMTTIIANVFEVPSVTVRITLDNFAVKISCGN